MDKFTVRVSGTPNKTVCASSNVAACIQPTGSIELNVTIWGAGGITPTQFNAMMEEYFSGLEVCDSDNVTSGTGNSAQDAGVAIGEFYMTASDHIEAPGGLPKKRLV